MIQDGTICMQHEEIQPQNLESREWGPEPIFLRTLRCEISRIHSYLIVCVIFTIHDFDLRFTIQVAILSSSLRCTYTTAMCCPYSCQLSTL